MGQESHCQHHHLRWPPSTQISMDHAPSANPRVHIPYSRSKTRRSIRRITANSPVGARLFTTIPFHLTTAHALEAVPLAIWSDASATYDAYHKAVTNGLSASRICRENTAWKQWDAFCACLHIPTDLQGIRDPAPFYKYLITRSI